MLNAIWKSQPYCCFCFRYCSVFKVQTWQNLLHRGGSRHWSFLCLLSCSQESMVGLRGLEPPTSRLSGVRSNHLSYKPIWFSASGRRFRLPTPFGGDEEDRTPDPLLARQVLSQLSYTPIGWSGSHLLSHAVSSGVPSAAYVLTVVFGMGTGVSHKRITTSKFVR